MFDKPRTVKKDGYTWSVRPDGSLEPSTEDGRLIRDVVDVIRNPRARQHFRQVNDLVRRGVIKIHRRRAGRR